MQPVARRDTGDHEQCNEPDSEPAVRQRSLFPTLCETLVLVRLHFFSPHRFRVFDLATPRAPASCWEAQTENVSNAPGWLEANFPVTSRALQIPTLFVLVLVNSTLSTGLQRPKPGWIAILYQY